MRLRSQVLLLQMVVLAVSLGLGFGLVISGSTSRLRDEYAQRALAIARSVATDDQVQAEVESQGGVLVPSELESGALQQQAGEVAERTDALFVVIANNQGLRLAHPDPAELAKPLSTDPSSALSGDEDLATDRGTLGESVRAKVPVYSLDGDQVVGLVSVGISTEQVRKDVRRDLLALAGIATGALFVGAIGSMLLARRWRRLTLGLEPDQLAELVREQGAVLHSISEGVVAIDGDGVVRVINDRARELLAITADVGSRVDEIGLTARVLEVARTPVADPRSATVGDRIVLVSSHPVRRENRDLGMVLSVVDRTDVESLTRQVDSIKAMSDALRASRHESANQMHLIAGLLRQGDSANALDYLDEVMGTGPYGTEVPGIENIDEPHLRAFVDAKAAVARERGVLLTLSEQTYLEGILAEPVVVTTIVGNLIDNAIEAVAGRPDAEVCVELISENETLLVTVADSGSGIAFDDPEQVFIEGVTTHVDSTVPGGRGMGLALSRLLACQSGGDLALVDRGGGVGADNRLGGAVFLARLPHMLEGPTP